MKKIHNKVKKHALGKLYKSNLHKTPKNLLEILKGEISKGNFNIKKQTTEGYQEGFVYYKKRNYFLVYNSNDNKIIRILSEKGYNRYIRLI